MMKLFLFLKKLHDDLVHKIVMWQGGYRPKEDEDEARMAASTGASTSLFQ